MNKDRISGIGKIVSGSIREAVGKITGDTRIQTEGTAQKIAGKAENAIGGAKDKVRDGLSE